MSTKIKIVIAISICFMVAGVLSFIGVCCTIVQDSYNPILTDAQKTKPPYWFQDQLNSSHLNAPYNLLV
ncbi:hypothetical protein Q7C36_000657 [Tachysurus vachellii]|uniref:Uncharacterized protein n=1 Tax=Tachysurus vachellii TaxID=175792 RepID=A0AA88NZK3_TACVA|nr:hypothetical protein Q7C36_000657 [Tachysurus vachellii]